MASRKYGYTKDGFYVEIMALTKGGSYVVALRADGVSLPNRLRIVEQVYDTPPLTDMHDQAISMSNDIIRLREEIATLQSQAAKERSLNKSLVHLDIPATQVFLALAEERYFDINFLVSHYHQNVAELQPVTWKGDRLVIGTSGVPHEHVDPRDITFRLRDGRFHSPRHSITYFCTEDQAREFALALWADFVDEARRRERVANRPLKTMKSLLLEASEEWGFDVDDIIEVVNKKIAIESQEKAQSLRDQLRDLEGCVDED